VELEAELARSAFNEARAQAAALHAALALRLGVDAASLALAGTLSPAPAPLAPRGPDAADDAGAVAGDTRPSLRHARAAAAHARDAGDAAGSAWVPPLTVTGGLRLRTTDEVRYGYVAGLAVDLPLFGRGQGLRAEAAARAREADALGLAATRAARIDAARAEAALGAALAELARFERETGERVERLLRAAESGYREGQRSVVELLDAERARAAVEGRRLDLALSARQAEIAARAARGELE
jgi:cobalt-zinc-cadmium efflux system outer membrane protein